MLLGRHAATSAPETVNASTAAVTSPAATSGFSFNSGSDPLRPYSEGGSGSRTVPVEQEQHAHHVIEVLPAGGHDASQGGDEDSPPSDPSQNQQRPQQRYDISLAARWLEQGIPFCLLLLVVFIRENFTGFLSFVWLTIVLIRTNDIIGRQAALKGDCQLPVLLWVVLMLCTQVAGLLMLFDPQEVALPLALRPLKQSPSFWHAVFIVFINDHIVRFGGMAVKCCILMAFGRCKARGYRRRAQLLTLVEYAVLLYRGLLPAPVWYRYFLNERLGHLFSSLLTGLYLTFKLSSILDRLLLFLAAVRQVVKREVQYGTVSTPEEVMKAGDVCSICHEKMEAPITLRCQHVFCDDCVSEWFEREQTCPLCRTVVRPPSLRSFSDASTTLAMQIF